MKNIFTYHLYTCTDYQTFGICCYLIRPFKRPGRIRKVKMGMLIRNGQIYLPDKIWTDWDTQSLLWEGEISVHYLLNGRGGTYSILLGKVVMGRLYELGCLKVRIQYFLFVWHVLPVSSVMKRSWILWLDFYPIMNQWAYLFKLAVTQDCLVYIKYFKDVSSL